MLTRRQNATLKKLQAKSSHPIQVLEHGEATASWATVDEGDGANVTLHCTFPNLFLTISPKGEIIKTETEAQRNQCERS